MVAPRWLARVNRRATNRATNRITLRLATRVPGFGVVVHTGRKSQRLFRTPVNVFPRRGGYVVALTYGSTSDWVRNVLARGGCTLETQGRTYSLTRPRLFEDRQRRAMPNPVRFVLGILHVCEFLDLTLEEPR